MQSMQNASSKREATLPMIFNIITSRSSREWTDAEWYIEKVPVALGVFSSSSSALVSIVIRILYIV